MVRSAVKGTARGGKGEAKVKIEAGSQPSGLVLSSIPTVSSLVDR